MERGHEILLLWQGKDQDDATWTEEGVCLGQFLNLIALRLENKVIWAELKNF